MSFNFSFINNLLNGRYQDVPDFTKKSVRIFLSSTFTDTNAERDYLIEKIYPRLKEYCKKNFDLDFQCADMRWGIPSDATEYHGTTELCLKEIRNCKKFSIGPTFVTIIGQKYGLRPLPRRVFAHEFDILKDQLENVLNKDLSLDYIVETQSKRMLHFHIENIIDECYKLDLNSVPNKYRLLQISKIVPSYNSPDPEENKHANRFWNMVEEKLSYLLRVSAESALKSNLIDKVKRDRYFVSITEKEIFEGIFKEKDPNLTSLCFVRHIQNLDNCLSDSKAARFIDVKKNENGNVELDTEARDLIEHLVEKKIPSKLNPKTNIFKYNVKWGNNQIDPDDLKKYLNDFGETFYNQIIRLINQAMIEEKNNFKRILQTYQEIGLIPKTSDIYGMYELDDKLSDLKNLIVEIGSHANEFNQLVSKFFGRDDLLLKIKNYLFSDVNIPFIVTGESGCGKTSVMALTHKMPLKIPSWVENSFNFITITRFLGTTMQTSSIFKTYKSIALQLICLISLQIKQLHKKSYQLFTKAHDLTSLVELIYFCFDEINKINSNTRIFIILDALDQLTPSDYQSVDKWLFKQLPSYVKLVVSTLPSHGNLLEMIEKLMFKHFQSTKQRKETTPENKDRTNELIKSNYLMVEELNATQCETILNNWLLAANKRLTDEQWSDLRTIFEKGTLYSLFLKLIYDTVVRLRSYEKLPDDFLKCLKIDDIIIFMFHQMEKAHGSVIFRRSISYMTVFKNGISDTELEDLLSIDDDVLYSVFQYHMPPIRRIPPILWIRIKNDLDEYIVEKEANDTKVIYWYHRRFIEVALSKYIQTKNKLENETMFQNIFDFYNETWKAKQKPFELNDYLKKKLNVSGSNMADRYIASQPIEYIADDGTTRYNKRKLTELPNCLANINSTYGLIKACELVFFNYDFMHAKFVCESINEVNEDLNKILSDARSWGYKEETILLIKVLKFMDRFLRLCGMQISDYPDSFGFNFTSRFLICYDQNIYIKNLIDSCDSLAIRHCSLISPYVQLEPPGGYMNSSFLKHEEPILGVIHYHFFLLTYSKSKISIHIVDDDMRFNYALAVPLPNMSKLNRYFESSTKTSIRNNANKVEIKDLFCILLDADFVLEKTFNADLCPLSFLVVSKSLMYIVLANGQLKFVYQPSHNEEILNAFLLNLRVLIIILKNSPFIKVFPNYEEQPFKFIDILICDMGCSIEQVALPPISQIIHAKKFRINFLIVQSNQMLKKMSVRLKYNNREQEQESDNLSSDSSLDNGFDYSDDSERNDNQEEPKNNKTETIEKIVHLDESSSLIVSTHLKLFPTGLDNLSVISMKPILSISNEYKDLNHSPYYLSTSDEQQIVELKFEAYNKQFAGFMRTKDHLFIFHLREQNKKETLCKFELKDKVELLEVLDENYFITSKEGIIDLYKYNCMKNIHRTKRLISINSYSRMITSLIVVESFILSGTINGAFNIYNFVFGKKTEKFYPNFDRTTNRIDKFYLDNFEALSISKNKEICVWDLNTGTIKSSVNIDETKLSSKINKTKLNQKRKLIVALMENGELAFFKNNNFIRKIQIHKPNEQRKLAILNRDITEFHIKPNECKTIVLFDLASFDLFLVKLLDGLQFSKIECELQRPLLKYENEFKRINMTDNLVIFAEKLKCMILVDKNLRNYSFFSFKNAHFTSKSIHAPITFTNYKDEKTVWNLFQSFPVANYKFKVLLFQDNHVYFSITVISENCDDSNESINRLRQTSVIVHAKLISTVNRLDESIEFEILRTYSYCKRFQFELIDDQIILFANLSNESDLNNLTLVNCSSNKTLFELDLINEQWISVESICVNQSLEYFAFFDRKGCVWLYRIKDSARLAHLPLYGEVYQIQFSKDNRYLCLNMNDRRIFNLLIVDPDCPEHINRIKQLPSRQVKKPTKPTVSKEESNKTDQVESESSDNEIFNQMTKSDDSSDDEEIDSSDSDAQPLDEERYLKDLELNGKIETATNKKVTIQKTTNVGRKKIKLSSKIVKNPNWLKDHLEKEKIHREKFKEQAKSNMNKLNVLKSFPNYLNSPNETEFITTTNSQTSDLQLLPYYEELNNDPSLKKPDNIKVTTNISKTCILS